VRIFDLWQAKLGSVLLSLVLYVNLQNSKILVKNFNIPIEYPRLSQSMHYSKNTEKTFLVRLEGYKDLVNYHSQFMKVIIDPNELNIGENLYEVKKIYGVPSNGIKLTKLGQKIPISIEASINKTIPVEINFEDEPPVGYIRSSYFIKPSSITVSGPKSILDKYNKLFIGTFSLKEHTDSFTRTIKIPDLPKNISLLSLNKDFSIRVNIIKDLSTLGEQIIIQLPVKCESKDPSLEADLSVDEVAIKFTSTSKFNSIQVIQGIQATVPCYNYYDKKQKKILPSSNPTLSKVKVTKSNDLKNIEILGVSPEKVLVSYKLKPGVEEKKDPNEDLYFPDTDIYEDKK
jgi:hypothetical protein